MRRYEMREGTSSKFWEVEVREKDVVVRFGRIGTTGQTKTQRAADVDAARKAAEKLVREKLGKGYAEAGSKNAAPPPAVSETKAKAKTETKAKAESKPKSRSKGRATPSVAESWERIERWFAKRPELALRLRPGASESQIRAAEEALGVTFPDDFRESVRIHDGQSEECAVLWLPHAGWLGSLESMVGCWQGDRKYYDAPEIEKRVDWLDKSKRVRQVHLHPKHIPFAGNVCWDYGRLMFDYFPGPEGAAGQVIAREDIDLRFVAASFVALLAGVASDIERGKTKPSLNE